MAKPRKRVVDSLPATTFSDSDVEQMVHDNPEFARLTQKQQKVMYFMLLHLFDPDESQSDAKIARLANVDVRTVYNCRRNSLFNAVYAYFVKEMTKGRVGVLINRLFDHSKQNTKAAEILLRYSDQLITKTQSVTANINYSAVNTATHLENLVMALKAAGYTKERLLTEVEDAWNSVT